MTKGGILVRELTDADADTACALLAELGYGVDLDGLRRRIAVLASSPQSDALVAIDADGTLVALASLHRLSLLTEDAPVGMITSLVVAERARGRGIGRTVVDELCRRAQAAGCRRVTLTTHLRRVGAHAFYERLGFEYTGRRYVRTL